jgi:hypothetical protein
MDTIPHARIFDRDIDTLLEKVKRQGTTARRDGVEDWGQRTIITCLVRIGTSSQQAAGYSFPAVITSKQ